MDYTRFNYVTAQPDRRSSVIRIVGALGHLYGELGLA
jgi:hypothetical protein